MFHFQDPAVAATVAVAVAAPAAVDSAQSIINGLLMCPQFSSLFVVTLDLLFLLDIVVLLLDVDK